MQRELFYPLQKTGIGGTGFGSLWGIRAGYFILRFVGTCAVFYPFFLCRTIGAGDIKLMGVIAGFLGVWDGVFVIGLGMILPPLLLRLTG